MINLATSLTANDLKLSILDRLEDAYKVEFRNLEIKRDFIEAMHTVGLHNAANRIDSEKRFVSDGQKRQVDIDSHLFRLAEDVAYALRKENYTSRPGNLAFGEHAYRDALNRIGNGLADYVQRIPAGTIVPDVSTDAGASGAKVGSFYGKEAKKALGDFAKEIDKDAKVVVKSIPVFADGNHVNVDAYSVEITDSMREQYRNKGFKLFTPAIAGGYLMEQTLRAEIEKRRKAMLED